MKDFRIGPVTVRGDFKATRKQIEKTFSKFLTEEQIDEFDAKVNGKKNGTKSTKRKTD